MVLAKAFPIPVQNHMLLQQGMSWSDKTFQEMFGIKRGFEIDLEFLSTEGSKLHFLHGNCFKAAQNCTI